MFRAQSVLRWGKETRNAPAALPRSRALTLPPPTLPCALHGGGNAVDAQEDGLAEGLLVGVVRAGPIPLQKFDLNQIEHVGVRVPELDRLLEDRIAVEQGLLVGNFENGGLRPLVVVHDGGVKRRVHVGEGVVPLGDGETRAGHLALGAVEDGPKEGPVLVQIPERVAGVGLVLQEGGEALAGAVPARRDVAGLRPREHPRDGAQVLELDLLPCRGPGDGPRGDGQAADVFDGRGRGVPLPPLGVVDEGAVGGHALLGEAVHEGDHVGLHRHLVGQQGVLGSRGVLGAGRGRKGRVHDLLHVAPRNVGQGVPERDDLALLGHPDAAVVHDGRERLDGLRGVAAAAPHGAAAPVEETQVHVVLVAHHAERMDGLVEGPVGHPVAAVLVAVGVAQHDLLEAVAPLQLRGIDRVREERLHPVVGGVEVSIVSKSGTTSSGHR